jgi:hypothetical protein
MICCNRQNTFSNWALQISLLSKKTVSKQGVFDRIGENTVTFSKQLLEEVLSKQFTKNYASILFDKFNDVLLQDSTTLRLPKILSSIFKGNHANGEQKAVARIQSVFNIKKMAFSYFSLGSFTENDQSASSSILPILKQGDLVIRDMGYFAIDTYKKIIAAKAHFLSRLKYGVTISDESGKVISLKKLLSQKDGIDKWVYIGVKNRLKVRLIMTPLPKAVAAEKIRKAKNHKDARFNHSKEYYQWLKFNIYVTSVEDDVWNTTDVGMAYKVRWQIEIIFKSWKSGFNLQDVLHDGCTNDKRVKVIIYLMLVYMCLVMKKIYVEYKNRIEKNNTKIISLIKLSVMVNNNIKEVLTLPQKVLKELIIRNCCYESRTDRANMIDLFRNFKS